MKTILVTGGCGFIGSHFILRLLHSPERKVQVVNLDALTYAGNRENLSAVEQDGRYRFIHGDICDRSLLEALFRKYPIDWVVNFAAETHVDRSILKPGVFLRTNVEGVGCLLDAAKTAWQVGEDRYREGVRFLQISTDEVYGSIEVGYFDEEAPLLPSSPYSASKAGADLLVTAYYTTYGLPGMITRCTNNYGPRQFPEKLIPLVIHRALSQQEVPVYGDGMQVRDWLHVEDHCRALEAVLERGRPGEVYHIGGNNAHTNLALVEEILALLGKKDPIVGIHLIRHVTDRKGHDQRYGMNCAKIRQELGWQPEVPWETGLEKTVNWYREHRTWLGQAAERAEFDSSH